MGTQLPLPQRGTAPQFSAHICGGRMAAWIIMSLGMELGLSPGDFVLDGDPAPTPKGGRTYSTIFGPFLLWPNGWMHQDVTWYRCRPKPRGLCVRWRPSPPPQKEGRATPKFSAHVCSGQKAGWIKMLLGTEVGLGIRNVVFDVDPTTPRKRYTHPCPIFGPCLLWPNGSMDQDATWYGSRPRPGATLC